MIKQFKTLEYMKDKESQEKWKGKDKEPLKINFLVEIV